jgi:hypothetical protein
MTGMRYTRGNVIRDAALTAPAILFGARRALAASDAAEISQDASAALRRLEVMTIAQSRLAKRLQGFWCSRRS